MPEKKETFEARLQQLETIADALENGTVPLEESIALFEKGTALARGLQKELSDAVQKFEILREEAPSDA